MDQQPARVKMSLPMKWSLRSFPILAIPWCSAWLLSLIAKRTSQCPIFLQLLLATVLYRSEMSQDIQPSGAQSSPLAGVGPSCPLSSVCVGTGCTDLNFRGFILQLKSTPVPAARVLLCFVQRESLNLRFSFYFGEMPSWRVPELVCTAFYVTQLPNKINKNWRALGVVLRCSVAWVYWHILSFPYCLFYCFKFAFV